MSAGHSAPLKPYQLFWKKVGQKTLFFANGIKKIFYNAIDNEKQL